MKQLWWFSVKMETYCAICGVGFGVETSIYNTDYNEDRSDDIPRMTDAGRLTNDDVMWTYDFVARELFLLQLCRP